MSAYGAYGFAEHGKGYRFILAHYYSGTTIGTISRAAGGPGPARHLPRRRRLQRRHQRLRRASSTRPAATRRTGSAARSSCAAPAASRWPTAARKLRAAGAGTIAIAGDGTLPRRPRDGADRKRGGLAQRRQRARRRPVRERRDPERVAALLAARRAQSAGGRLALLRPHRRRRRQRLRPLRRHPQPGLRGAGKRVRGDQRSRRRDPRPGRRCTTAKIAQTLFSACSGGHTESIAERLRRRRDPLPPVGVPDPYDYGLPAAHLDARIQRPGDQRQARRPTSTGG